MHSRVRWALPVLALVLCGVTPGARSETAESPQAAEPAARLKEAQALIGRRELPAAIAILDPLIEDPRVAADPALHVDTLIQAATAHYQRNEYPRALALYERAKSICSTLADPAKEARVEFGLGQVTKSQGEYPRAIGHTTRALNLYTGSQDRNGRARSLMLLGSLQDLTGRYPEALESYRAAQLIFEQTNPTLSYRILNEIGITLKNLGEYQAALDHYQRAMAGQVRLNDRYGQAVTLNNVAVVYLLLGQDDEAITTLQRALTLAREIEDRRGQSILLGNIGEILLDRGQYARATDYLEQQLRLTETLGNRNEEANARKSLGNAALATGNLALARSRYIEALEIQRAIKARWREGNTLLALAEVSRKEGRFDEAVASARDALAIARETGSRELEWKSHLALGQLLRANGRIEDAIGELSAGAAIINDLRANVGTDTLKIGFLDERQEIFREWASTLLEAGRAEEALQAAETGRARAFADLLEQRLIRGKPTERESLALVRTTLQEARRAVAAERTRTGGAGSESSALDEQLAALRGTHRELASLLTAESATTPEIRDTARRLNATLVEYLVTEQRLLVWVIQPAGAVHAVAIDATRAKLETRAAQVYRAVSVEHGRTAAPVRALRPQLRDLHRILIAPIAQWLPTRADDVVVVVPSGPLALVPFSALENARGIPLLARHTLAYAPSASVFRYTAARLVRGGAAARALIVADPRPPATAHVPPLAGARMEGRLVKRLIGASATLVEGRRASESLIKRAAGKYQILHFATHGVVSAERPLASSLLLSPGSGEDGYLRLDEIFSLPLSASLVVLSGCSTGMGRLSGDGIIGLSRAFMYAGTPSMIVSQWDVSDVATAHLMDRLYRELRGGATVATALRRAQLATRARYPSPFFWAPFTLVGEPGWHERISD